ncbi:transposase [Desulfobulbus sp. US5]|nr:transposase [Desulfobulbus sp. N3]MCW5213975.1 transposase [Desulfobulbus sp. US5]WLE95306.1 MAG: transposase [Candidatus Electrothrix communis]
MPRTARIILANTPHHIVQRGRSRQSVFFADDDYSYYLKNLLYFKQKFSCKVYAYCLMTNHVHLIIDPGDTPESLSKLMKRVAGRQTRYVNRQEKRSGSIWEGRYRSSIISTKDYLLACCRYIELNPLRAGMIADPVLYKWSSFACKTTDRQDPIIDYPPSYLSLEDNKKKRQKTYAKYAIGTVPEHETNLIREALQRGQLTGSDWFREEISRMTGVQFSNRGPGRPKK